MRVLRKLLDGAGDEWWDVEGEPGWRLAGRSATSSMAQWSIGEIEERWGPVRSLDDVPPPSSDRGRDTSSELVEVRTVLGRAENAIATLTKYRDRELYRPRPTRHPAGRGFVDDRTPDPDVEDMIAELEQVVSRLSRWRRTGRPPKG